MPIYEFECQSCHHVWDRLQRLSDPDPDRCPACGSVQVGRRVTAAAFRLKGSGWYETDFKSDKNQQRNLAGEKDPAAASESGVSEKSSSDKPAPEKSGAETSSPKESSKGASAPSASATPSE